jgi:nitroreductase
MADALFLIENRKTVTNFTSKEIPADVLSNVLNCARVTPTNKHFQEWRFVVIKDSATKNKLNELTNAEAFLTAPVVVAVFSKNSKFNIEYASAATEAMLLAASNYNLGTYWHIVNNEPYAKNIVSLLNAPEEYYLMGLVAMGYYNFVSPSFQKLQSLSEMTIIEKFKL